MNRSIGVFTQASFFTAADQPDAEESTTSAADIPPLRDPALERFFLRRGKCL